MDDFKVLDKEIRGLYSQIAFSIRKGLEEEFLVVAFPASLVGIGAKKPNKSKMKLQMKQDDVFHRSE